MTDVTDEDSSWLRIVDIAHKERITEITENSHCAAKVVGSDETDIVAVTNGIKLLLLLVEKVCCNYDLCKTELR